MIVGIHQPQYLPWLGYFDKMDQSDTFVLLDTVQFKKNEWQNRNRIKTPQGVQWLTVPVLHDFGQLIQDVKINNQTKWRKANLRAIDLNYRRAPYFDEYYPTFQEIFEQEWQSLSELNIFIIKKLVTFLGIETKLVLASEYQVTEEQTQRLIDLCQALHGDTYLSGVDGSKYMDVEKFKASGLKIKTQQYVHPKYSQLWSKQDEDGFVPYLSVLDLLMNHGSKSLAIIRKNRNHESLL